MFKQIIINNINTYDTVLMTCIVSMFSKENLNEDNHYLHLHCSNDRDPHKYDCSE